MKQVFSAKVKTHLLINEEHPAVYVGTYKKYNEGSLFGAWLDLLTFDDFDDYLATCHALHHDELDPELMVQDFMNFENGHGIEAELLSRETFDRIHQLAEFTELEQDIIKEFWAEVDNSADPATILNRLLFVGDLSDFAYDSADEWLDSICFDHRTAEAVRPYFDYGAFERDLSYELTITTNYIFSQQ